MKVEYPDNRRPFNLADYMHTNTNRNRNTNTNSNKNADLTYYKYYTGNTNKDGTAEFIPITKVSKSEREKILYTNNELRKTEPKTVGKSKGITLEDLMRNRDRKTFF